METNTLRELIGLGFPHMMALMIIAVVVLWSALVAVIIVVYRKMTRERAESRKAMREELDEMSGKIDASEAKHQECEKDRGEIKLKLAAWEERMRLIDSCPVSSCPFRRPHIVVDGH